MSDFKIVSLLNPGINYNNVSGILAASLSGNTDGVLAAISTGTLILAGGNNITLSQDGQSVSIIGGAGGGGGGGVAIAAGTQTATTNTIVFSNSNGITFGMSGSTRITASYTVPSTAGLLSAVNISGGTTSNNLSALTFNNGNGVSFGLNGSTLTATVKTDYQTSGAYLTTAMLSDAATISNIKISAGLSSANLSALTFDNGNGVSFGLSAGTITGSVAAAGGAQTAISGIIVSDATYTSGTVSFSNQNGVTIGSSVNGATQYIRLSVATNYQSQGAYLTTAALSGDTSKYLENWKLTGNTAGTTSSAQGTDLWLAGGNGVTLSGNSNTITVSVATNYQSQGAYLTTAALSGDTSKYVQNWKLTGNTAGTTSSAQGTDLWFSGGNNITLSGNSNTIIVSAANAGGAQTAISGIIVSDATYTSGTVSFSNAGNITISSSVNGATQYIRLSGNAAQTNQSAIRGFGVSNTGNTLGNTGISTGIDWVIAASGAITASQSTAGGGPNTVWVSVASQTVQSAIKAFGASNTGNTSGNTGVSTGIDWVIAGTNNVTISESTVGGGPNTLWISGPSPGAAAVTFGMSNLGNTAGTTGTVNGQFIVVGGNNVTASQSINGQSATITISAFNQSNQSEGWYAVGNTTSSASSTTLDARSVSINALGGVSAGYSNGSVQISAPPVSQLTGVAPVSLSSNGSTISVFLNQASEFAPYRFAGESPLTNSTLGQSSLFFYPMDVPYPISGSRINVFISLATTTSGVNSTGAGSIGLGYGLYTRGTGASSERLSQLTSYSLQLLTYTFSSNTRFGMTHYIGLSNATSHSTSTASSAAAGASNYFANSVGGYRAVALPLNQSLTPGRYWIGLSHQSTTSNTNAMQVTMAAFIQLTASNQIAFRPFGTSSAASDASIYGFYAGQGTYSAQSAAWPASIGLSNSDIKQPLVVTLPYFNISGIGTSTNLL